MPEDYSVAIVTLRQRGAGEIHTQGKATQVQTEKNPNKIYQNKMNILTAMSEPVKRSESIWEVAHPSVLFLLILGRPLLATVRDEIDWLNTPLVKTSTRF